MPMSFFRQEDANSRLRNLDRRGLMIALFVGALLIYFVGALLSPYEYSDTRFVIHYLTTELQVVAYLLLMTALFLPARRLGLRRPELVRWLYVLPFVWWLMVALGAWLFRYLTLPPTAQAGPDWMILRTTLLVGVTEEWIFRGLVFAVLARWLGLRRGAYLALAAFGAFHLLNVAVGVPVSVALLQVVLAALSGSILLLAAVGLRSLWMPMLGHAFYDFVVFDVGNMTNLAGDNSPLALVLMANGVVLGIICMMLIAKLPGDEPYPE
jgi:uncharacterized protein